MDGNHSCGYQTVGERVVGGLGPGLLPIAAMMEADEGGYMMTSSVSPSANQNTPFSKLGAHNLPH